MKNRNIILAVLIALLLVFCTGCDWLWGDVGPENENNSESVTEDENESESVLDSMPKHVQESFSNYDSNNWESKSDKTKGTHDNSKFQNRDGDLPEEDGDGNKIEYREHDVNNKKDGHGRDAERFVSGSDGSVYYTDDHYESFIQLK